MSIEQNLLTILDRAIDVIGNREAAIEWMDKHSATLGARPRQLADSDEGRDRVLLHLNGISRHRIG
jgi:uncharacterized protein (DUF2384 family)